LHVLARLDKPDGENSMEEPPPPVPTTSTFSSGAGFGIRLLARIVDTIYGILLGFFGGILGGIAVVILQRAGWIEADWQYRLRGTSMVGIGFGILASFLYHLITEGMCGASVGKLACHLRVVTEDGRAIGMWPAFLRSLAYFWDSLFFGLVGYSSMKKSDLNQRYGDHWAHTVVVKRTDVPEGARKGAEVFVLAYLMASACSIVIIALSIIVRVRT
jgi:uncharacterized RDD family membrane protein YckC